MQRGHHAVKSLREHAFQEKATELRKIIILIALTVAEKCFFTFISCFLVGYVFSGGSFIPRRILSQVQ